MSQSSHDSVDETLGDELQEELRDTLSGLAPRTQDPDEDEAYTPTQLEERSWDAFEENPLDLNEKLDPAKEPSRHNAWAAG